MAKISAIHGPNSITLNVNLTEEEWKNCGTGAGGFKPGNSCNGRQSGRVQSSEVGPNQAALKLVIQKQTEMAAEANHHFYDDHSLYSPSYHRVINLPHVKSHLDKIHSAVLEHTKELEALHAQHKIKQESNLTEAVKLSSVMSDMKKDPNHDPVKFQEVKSKASVLIEKIQNEGKEITEKLKQAVPGALDVIRNETELHNKSGHGNYSAMKNVQFPIDHNPNVGSDLQREVHSTEGMLQGILSSAHDDRISGTPIRLIAKEHEQREYYSHADLSVRLTNNSKYTTVAHEYGHVMEQHSGVRSIVYGFAASRIGKYGQAQPMGAGYGPGEAGFDDDFKKTFGDKARYVGKYYRGGDTEILSMGVQKLLEDPGGFAKSDPEYFKMTVGVLNGSLL